MGTIFSKGLNVMLPSLKSLPKKNANIGAKSLSRKTNSKEHL